MTNGLIQHIIMEESTSIQWVNLLSVSVVKKMLLLLISCLSGELRKSEEMATCPKPAKPDKHVIMKYWHGFLFIMLSCFISQCYLGTSFGQNTSFSRHCSVIWALCELQNALPDNK